MKKLFLFLLLTTITTRAYANPNPYDAIYNDYQAVYLPSESIWAAGGVADDRIVLTKKLIDGTGSYSRYNYEDGSLAFALSTDCEFIKNGKLIIVDNNLLKYSKIVYEDGSFHEVSLAEEEIQEIFPQAEIFKISWIDQDNKEWIHKPLGKKKTILLVNDTEKYFHKITCKTKNVQDAEIKGLVTFPRYGIFKFTHFGERDGKITFYIR